MTDDYISKLIYGGLQSNPLTNTAMQSIQAVENIVGPMTTNTYTPKGAPACNPLLQSCIGQSKFEADLYFQASEMSGLLANPTKFNQDIFNATVTPGLKAIVSSYNAGTGMWDYGTQGVKNAISDATSPISDIVDDAKEAGDKLTFGLGVLGIIILIGIILYVATRGKK